MKIPFNRFGLAATTVLMLVNAIECVIDHAYLWTLAFCIVAGIGFVTVLDLTINTHAKRTEEET